MYKRSFNIWMIFIGGGRSYFGLECFSKTILGTWWWNLIRCKISDVFFHKKYENIGYIWWGYKMTKLDDFQSSKNFLLYFLMILYYWHYHMILSSIPSTKNWKYTIITHSDKNNFSTQGDRDMFWRNVFLLRSLLIKKRSHKYEMTASHS